MKLWRTLQRAASTLLSTPVWSQSRGRGPWRSSLQAWGSSQAVAPCARVFHERPGDYQRKSENFRRSRPFRLSTRLDGRRSGNFRWWALSFLLRLPCAVFLILFGSLQEGFRVGKWRCYLCDGVTRSKPVRRTRSAVARNSRMLTAGPLLLTDDRERPILLLTQPQPVQQHGQLARHRHHGAFLGGAAATGMLP